MVRDILTEDFIKRGKAIRTDVDFDYSEVKYVNSKTKVTIIDPKYGTFKVTPDKFLNRCTGHKQRAIDDRADKKRKKISDFIPKFCKKWGIRYDYSKSIYITNDTKIEIYDTFKRETFWQTPSSHLKSGNDLVVITTEVFITRGNELFNNFYDYSKVKCNSGGDIVTIIDPDYGEFEIVARQHLKGHGHKKRGMDVKIKKLLKNTKTFIDEANLVHNYTYDYSKTVYSGSHEKVLIIDPIFGEFEQSATDHLSGKGHKSRSKSGFDTNKKGIFYINTDGGCIDKAGITNKKIEYRIAQQNRSFLKEYGYKNHWSNKLCIFFTDEKGGYLAYELETLIHKVHDVGYYGDGYGYQAGDGFTETYFCNDEITNPIIQEFCKLHEGKFIVERDVDGILGEIIL